MSIVTLTFKINRVHPLIIVNMSAEFAEEAHNGSVSFAFTRSKHGHTAALLYQYRNALHGDNDFTVYSVKVT